MKSFLIARRDATGEQASTTMTDDFWINGFNCFWSNGAQRFHGRSTDWKTGWHDAAALCQRIDRKFVLSGKPYDPFLCLNCFEAVASTNPLKIYCSHACAQTAEKVRELRRWKILHGDFDIHEMLATVSRVTSIVFSGGYDKRARYVTLELRKQIFERAGFKCEQCHVPFDDDGRRGTIQHMHGPSNELSNLEAWCWQCNTLGPLRVVRPAMLKCYSPEQLEMMQYRPVENADSWREPQLEIALKEIDLRVKAKEIICHCDGEHWDAKQFQSQRRMMLGKVALQSRANARPLRRLPRVDLLDEDLDIESEYDYEIDTGEYIWNVGGIRD